MASSETIKKYYNQLGIQPNATINEIKKAYRKKAMTIHPDVNPSPSAAEEFVKLNSCYEALLNFKSTGYFSTSKKSTYSKPKKSPVERYRDELRTKLEEIEKAKIRQYVYSAAYRKNFNLNSLFDIALMAGLALFYPIVVFVFIPASAPTYDLRGEPVYTVNPTFSLIVILVLTGLLTWATVSSIRTNRRKRKKFLEKVAAYKVKHNIDNFKNHAKPKFEEAKIKRYVQSKAYRKSYHLNALADHFSVAGLLLFYGVVIYTLITLILIPRSWPIETPYSSHFSLIVMLVIVFIIATSFALVVLYSIRTGRSKRKKFLEKVAAYKVKHNIK